jgi:pimeloyl-ACP methyl ester carboxylesterase
MKMQSVLTIGFLISRYWIVQATKRFSFNCSTITDLILRYIHNGKITLKKYQPPTLVVWGRNDFIFPKEGAISYQRDLKNIEVHLLNTGHFALEEEGELIAELISRFLISIRHTIPGYLISQAQ